MVRNHSEDVGRWGRRGRGKTKMTLRKKNMAKWPDFWGRDPGFKSSISHNDPDVLQDHCIIQSRKSQGREGNLPLRLNKIKFKKL